MFNLSQNIKSYFIIIFLFFNIMVTPSHHELSSKSSTIPFKLKHSRTNFRHYANTNRYEHGDYSDVGSDHDYLDSDPEYEERCEQMQETVTRHGFDERNNSFDERYTSQLRLKKQSEQNLVDEEYKQRLDALRKKVLLIRERRNALKELETQESQKPALLIEAQATSLQSKLCSKFTQLFTRLVDGRFWKKEDISTFSSVFHPAQSKRGTNEERKAIVQTIPQYALDIPVASNGSSMGHFFLLNNEFILFRDWLSRKPSCSAFTDHKDKRLEYNNFSILHLLCTKNLTDFPDMAQLISEIVNINNKLIIAENGRGRTPIDLLLYNKNIDDNSTKELLKNLIDKLPDRFDKNPLIFKTLYYWHSKDSKPNSAQYLQSIIESK